MKGEMLKSFFRLLLALAIGLVVSSLFIVLAGESPLNAYGAMLNGAFVGKSNVMSTLRWATPYIAAGIASMVAVRAGLFNMGLDGCIYLGGLAAALVGTYVTGLPQILHILLCFAASILVGAVWMTLPAALKAYYGVNEVILTWMMSYIAVLLCKFLVSEYFQRPEDIASAVQQVRTPPIAETAKLPLFAPPHMLNYGLFIAVVMVIVYYLFANRTKSGYEHKMIGLAPGFAAYGGVNTPKIQMFSLIASGAIGAMVGAMEVLGVHGRYIQGFAQDMGANGIMVSLMGRLNPIGVPLAGIFMGAVQNGARAMSRSTNVTVDTIRIMIAVIIICITADGLFEFLRIKRKMRDGD